MSDHMKRFTVTRENGRVDGEISLSYNYLQPDENKELFLKVEDEDEDTVFVTIQPDEALEILHHLNFLLGNPLLRTAELE